MATDPPSNEQVERFHEQVIDLVKKYQFRNRNREICCGLSVSQCYVLETLRRFGPLSMNNLAEKMHLTISTVTRVLQPLLRRKYVTREEDPDDRRIRLISLTPQGKAFALEAWKNSLESEKIILSNFPAENREMLITFIKNLNHAVSQWQSCCND